MATLFGKRGIAVRIHNQIRKGCFIVFIITMFLPSCIFAKAQDFSPEEIQSIQKATQQQLNNEAVQRWVKTIEHYNPSQPTTNNQIIKKRRNILMIFVSFSMSDTSLRRYLNECQRIRASLVLRGLINNSFTDTARKVHGVIQKNQGGFSIDPIAFEKLHINKVPAIVLFNQAGLICLNDQECTLDSDDYDIIEGQVTLDYALSQFAKGDGVIAKSAKTLLKQLRESNSD